MFHCQIKKLPNYYFRKTKPENDITELDQQQKLRNNKIQNITAKEESIVLSEYK